MLNKNVCPKCGQLYEMELAACPVCNTPAQVLPQAEQPVQRRRLTEVERRERQQAQKKEAAAARQREKDSRRASDAEEERLLEEEEERLRLERQRRKLEKRGLSSEEIERRLSGKEERPEKEDRPIRQRDGRTPAVFSWMSILLSLLALAIGVTFLLWRMGKLDFPFYDSLEKSIPAASQPALPDCTGLTLKEQTIELPAAGSTYSLEYILQPEGCADPVTFRTSDESVAMVGELGIVTAVGPGTATVTAVCGEFTAECTVFCNFAAETTAATEAVDLSNGLILNNVDITFREAGESAYLEVTNLPAGADVFWATSNEEVATVDEKGYVVAVGRGTCYITAVVNDYTESCIVRCNFED